MMSVPWMNNLSAYSLNKKTRKDMWSEYFKLLIEFEGSVYENDPDDPGGATKYGIDQRSHPGVNIRSLTLDQAEHIYREEFIRSFAKDLPEPLTYVVFDFIVNAGSGAGAKAIQRAVGVTADGAVGPKTFHAIKQYLDSMGQVSLIKSFSEERNGFYQRLSSSRPRMKKFLKGWLRRSNTIRDWALNTLS